jgi:ABC-type antimicrobial peptide transport system permease subunit
LLIAWPLSMNFNELLFGGNALGWSTVAYALSVIVLGLLLACVLPARRALRADPNLILKQE